MTFPTATLFSGNSGGNTTSYVINLPDNLAADDIILLAVCKDGTGGATWPTDPAWFNMAAPSSDSHNISFRNRRVDGTEGWGGTGNSITVTGASEGWAHAGALLVGAHGTSALFNPTAVVENTGSTAPDPPTANPSAWDVEDTLWVSIFGWDGNQSHVAYSADYTVDQITDRWAHANGSGIAMATRENRVASEDPGAGEISGSEEWIAFTVAVRPAVPDPEDVTGTADVVLPPLAASASGSVDVEGTATAVLPALDASLAGTVSEPGITGTVSVVLPALGATTAGEVTVTGTADALLPALGAGATGEVEVTGTADVLLPALDVSLTGEVEISGVAGTVNAVLPALSATAEGEVGVVGTVDATLPALAASAVGLVEVEGSLTATLPALSATSTGAVTVEGTSVTVLPALDASFDGTVTDVGVVGTVDATLPPLEAQASGVLGIEGTVSVTLPALSVVLSGVAGILVPPVLPTYSFFPPTVDEHLDSGHAFRRRLHFLQGVSVVRDPGAGFVNKRAPLPEPDWVEGIDFFVGGYRYSGISEEIGLELIAAGYAPVLE